MASVRPRIVPRLTKQGHSTTHWGATGCPRMARAGNLMPLPHHALALSRNTPFAWGKARPPQLRHPPTFPQPPATMLHAHGFPHTVRARPQSPHLNVSPAPYALAAPWHALAWGLAPPRWFPNAPTRPGHVGGPTMPGHIRWHPHVTDAWQHVAMPLPWPSHVRTCLGQAAPKAGNHYPPKEHLVHFAK